MTTDTAKTKTGPKILLVSRCAWTLYNFRAGLMRALQKQGYQVVCGGSDGDGFEQRIRALDIPFDPLPLSRQGMDPLADFWLIVALYRWYRNQEPAIVHHFTIKPVIYGSIAAWLAGVPRIINTVTGLGFVFTARKNGWLQTVVKRLYRLALGRADYTFFLNEEDRDFFVAQKLVRAQKTGLLPGEGVDCRFFSPRAVSVPKQRERFVFLLMARLLYDKGVAEFVAAARHLKPRYPTAEFALLGARDTRNPQVIPRAVLDRWEAEGVVRYWGEAADVRPFLQRADVLVLPSYYREGVPRSLMEGAAMEKPLIATDSVGCREVVADGVNGLLVPVRDAEALAGAMQRFLEEPGLGEKMGRAGRKRVLSGFDENHVIETILSRYQE